MRYFLEKKNCQNYRGVLAPDSVFITSLLIQLFISARFSTKCSVFVDGGTKILLFVPKVGCISYATVISI